MRIACLLTVTSLAACGSSNKTNMADASTKTNGFIKPTSSLKANDNNMELGPADLTCLGTPSSDMATTVQISLHTIVKDFQNKTPVAQAMVTMFDGINVGSPFAMATSDQNAYAVFTVPTGRKRFGFKMTGDFMTTLLLNQYLDPAMAVQPAGSDTDPTKGMTIQTVSNGTAAALPAIIGETRTAGTGVLAGALRDCQHHEISHFAATVSSTQGTATPIDGAETFFFSAGVDLPAHHNVQPEASADGLFMVIQLPVTQTAYVQMWGYPTDADVASDNYKLISELAVPVLGDTVVTGSYEPLRTN